MRDELFRGVLAGKSRMLVWIVMFLVVSSLPAKADGSGSSLSIGDIPDWRPEADCERSSEFCEREAGSGNSPREKHYAEILQGYPMAGMSYWLSKEDDDVADFLIAIAKKESDWGKHAPSKDGQDCFNYWGYKGQEESQVLGYSCFGSPEEAVEKVGARIGKLLEKGLNTPDKMVVWKCGSSCRDHDPKSVAGWISDVRSVLGSLRSRQEQKVPTVVGMAVPTSVGTDYRL